MPQCLISSAQGLFVNTAGERFALNSLDGFLPPNFRFFEGIEFDNDSTYTAARAMDVQDCDRQGLQALCINGWDIGGNFQVRDSGDPLVGHGLFADEGFEKGHFLMVYSGKNSAKYQDDNMSKAVYQSNYPGASEGAVYAHECGGLARFAQHAPCQETLSNSYIINEGVVAATANTKVLSQWLQVGHDEFIQVKVLQAAEPISAGDPILYDYCQGDPFMSYWQALRTMPYLLDNNGCKLAREDYKLTQCFLSYDGNPFLLSEPLDVADLGGKSFAMLNENVMSLFEVRRQLFQANVLGSENIGPITPESDVLKNILAVLKGKFHVDPLLFYTFPVVGQGADEVRDAIELSIFMPINISRGGAIYNILYAAFAACRSKHEGVNTIATHDSALGVGISFCDGPKLEAACQLLTKEWSVESATRLRLHALTVEMLGDNNSGLWVERAQQLSGVACVMAYMKFPEGRRQEAERFAGSLLSSGGIHASIKNARRTGNPCVAVNLTSSSPGV